MEPIVKIICRPGNYREFLDYNFRLCANFVYKIIKTVKNFISKLRNFIAKLKTLSYSEFNFLN
jgi:hypothetical protein